MAPTDSGQPQDPSTPDHSALLYGKWAGTLSGESYGGQVTQTLEIRPDGSCDWATVFPDLHEHPGWTWQVSGAQHLPDWNDPWVLNLRDVASGDARSVRIVLIDEQSFLLREWTEMNTEDINEMLRVE